jgi:hypothetical protein
MELSQTVSFDRLDARKYNFRLLIWFLVMLTLTIGLAVSQQKPYAAMCGMGITILAPWILGKLFKTGAISTAVISLGEESIEIELQHKGNGTVISRDLFLYRDLSKIRLTRNTKNGTGHVRLYFRDGSKKIYTMNNGYEDAILSTAFSDRLAAYNSGVPEGERIEFGNPGT